MKVIKYISLAILVLIIMIGNFMFNKNQRIKNLRNKWPYIMVAFIHLALIGVSAAFVLIPGLSSKLLPIFVETMGGLNPECMPGAMLWTQIFFISLIFVGWYSIITSRNMDNDQRDSAVTWLLGACSASFFSLASWTISALGADNSNPYIWYLTILYIAWTIASSLTLAIHKVSLISEGKG